jgi:cation diffusion facilitator CzcD-associated flavoprotein CzcO
MPGIVITGAGFDGIGMAIALTKAGFHDFVVLEKSDDLGGTWHHNQYPGCACDVPSPLYSYSFELNPSWSRLFAPQQEMWDKSADLAGKRVAVIGTGASAIQFIPEIGRQAGHLEVFQRTPPWVHPRPDVPIPDRVRERFAASPTAARVACRHDRGARARAAALQPRTAAAAAARGVERGRMPQLVPGRRRRQPGPVAGVHLRVLGPHPAGSPIRLHRHARRPGRGHGRRGWP